MLRGGHTGIRGRPTDAPRRSYGHPWVFRPRMFRGRLRTEQPRMIHGCSAEVIRASVGIPSPDVPRRSEDGATADDPRMLRGGHTGIRGYSVPGCSTDV